MNIEVMKLFILVVDEQSLSKAAELSHISQSAVSQQIKSLERILGSQLLERSHKGAIPTAIGKIVYDHATMIVENYKKMVDTINSEQNLKRTLHIISTPSVSSYALPCTMHQVQKNYPTCTLKIESISSDLLEEKITKGSGDIGFIVGKPKNTLLTAKKVFSNTVHLVAGENFKIDSKIAKTELANYSLLLLPEFQKSRQVLDIYLKKIGINEQELQIGSHLDSLESIKMATVQGYGLSFLPYMAIKKELYHKQLRIIQLEDFDFQNHYYAIKRPQDKHLDNEVNQMITYIEKILKSTIC